MDWEGKWGRGEGGGKYQRSAGRKCANACCVRIRAKDRGKGGGRGHGPLTGRVGGHRGCPGPARAPAVYDARCNCIKSWRSHAASKACVGTSNSQISQIEVRVASQAVIIEARRGLIIRSTRVAMVDAGSMARGNPLDTPWDYVKGRVLQCHNSNFPGNTVMTLERTRL